MTISGNEIKDEAQIKRECYGHLPTYVNTMHKSAMIGMLLEALFVIGR